MANENQPQKEEKPPRDTSHYKNQNRDKDRAGGQKPAQTPTEEN